MKLSISRRAAESAKLSSYSEQDSLLKLKQENDKKITALKENFKDCEQIYLVFADIAITYYEISKGDYVSKLVEDEHHKREREEKKRNTNS